MKKWKCKICGHIHEAEEIPETCELCGIPKSQIIEITD